ncbi:putative alpha-galactosidase D [Pseudocercospora fuligena]|uniref:Alpha-galactosidase n=1 Tax=Pseudocercospora fuligena TaxID=685502 RepID=A0A8H6RGN6_9PEZI|nr:putative alpha-galactosidase D [Pseudocercospora fuligena]
MTKMTINHLIFCAFLSTGLVEALDNGFGRTPIMAFNTYNVAACTINQTWVRDTINNFVNMGFASVGYKQFGLDCGWQGKQRQSNGSIDYDRDVFPDGIKPLSDLAISKGLLWGMYTDQGKFACDTIGPQRVGSVGFEREDALQLAGWNTAYLKVDNCYIDGPNNNAPKNPRDDFKSRFGAMQNALSAVGIKGMLVCQWGVPYTNSSGLLYGPSEWTPPLATSYRMSDDIARGWGNIMRIYNQNIHIAQNDLTGPGRFADMDLLEVGNPGMTSAEQATHFAAWAFMKSPLIISTRLPVRALRRSEPGNSFISLPALTFEQEMTNEVKAILQNTRIIAINQDSLGKPVKLARRFSLDNDQFQGPLANGDIAILLVDQSNAQRSLGVEFPDYGISSATVTNLWTGETISNTNRYFTTVQAHGSVPLRLSNIVRSNVPAPTLRYYEAEAAQVAGNANVQSCSGCSGGQKVGYIGNGASNTLTFNNVITSQATQDVRFDYIDCEIGYLYDGGYGNVRGASISVNGGAAQSVVFPLSGYEWSKDVYKSFLVRLSGFRTSGSNTITISGLSSVSPYAPDIDRIGVIA